MNLQKMRTYAERLAKAVQSWNGKPLPTDCDVFDTPITMEIMEEFRKMRDQYKENLLGCSQR